ncbi:RNA-directed DNA polymerase [Chryseobacterium sp. L7]|uniref:RNA-directed DNA polymerase n=1 Tax=Chryseobacterium endalhagicum TaxID=2797638 RepID=A0ABS1QBZ3_9FLAO|nr:reverse transcriptase family protein [Chryseobacterium endalhagicum]MBL1220144.1 RNA-directed DNA polymerase [Chryseobacterium endalhagicum]
MKDFESYKKIFREKALNSAYSEENIIKCLKYSENLVNNNLPIIYNSYHLSGLVGYQHDYLSRAILSTEFFYRHFKIEKKNGKSRKISEPLPSLKEIQYFILKEILYKQKVSKFCKSYIPKKKFKEYLRFHSNEKEVLTLDIKDFFPSIKFNLIHNYFSKIGYSKDVALYLSCLCTYTDVNVEKKNNTSIRYLPQGAPTSPYLSNLVLIDFDNDVANYCSEKKLKYTRYADDMAFSGDLIVKNELVEFVNAQLKKYNLELNDEKINYMKQNVPQIISGVVVNKKLQLPRKERNDIRKVMYFIIKYGIESHIEKTQETREYYISYLLGRIQYALNLNPNDAELKKYKDFLVELKKNILIL